MQDIQNIAILTLATVNVVLIVIVLSERRPASPPEPKPERGWFLRFLIAIGFLREVQRPMASPASVVDVEEAKPTESADKPNSFLAIMKRRSEYEEGIRRMARLYMTITRLYTVEQKIHLNRDQLERIVLMVVRLRKLVAEDADYPRLKGFFQIYGAMRAIIAHAEKIGVARRGGNTSLDKTLERFSSLLGDDHITAEDIDNSDLGQSTVDSIKKLLFDNG